MNLQCTKIRTGTLEYYLRQRKNADTVVFVHGLGANLEQFAKQCDYFDNRFQVLILNLSGHGSSQSIRPFDLASCAQDIIYLLDALNIDKVHYVGNSMGGNIGFEILASFEHRLHSLTTFGTTGELNTSIIATKALGTMYRILPISLIANLASTSGRNKGSKHSIKTMMRQMDRQTILTIIPVLASFNYLEVIESSQVPLLLIKGEHDVDINKSLPSTLARLEKRNNTNVIELKGVGHFANLDAPEQFNVILESFLQTVATTYYKES
ncbi:MAG: alpha/beta hydrolase [Cyanobacteria bacterium P01_F01_bin.150]